MAIIAPTGRAFVDVVADPTAFGVFASITAVASPVVRGAFVDVLGHTSIRRTAPLVTRI